MSEYKIIIERDENIIFEKSIDADEALDFILQKIDPIETEQVKQVKTKKKYKKRTESGGSGRDGSDESSGGGELKKEGRGKRIMPEDINRMKELINLGKPVHEIASEFGVSDQTIYVLKRKMQESVI